MADLRLSDPGIPAVTESLKDDFIYIVQAGASKKITTQNFRRFYDVKAFGATGNGLTDDTAAIQSAALAASLVGGFLYLPEGIYIILSPIVISGHGVKVIGEGAVWDISTQGTTIQAGAAFAGTEIFKFEHAVDTYIRSVGMRDITIDGGVVSDCNGLNVVRGYDFCLFENVMVQNISDTKYAWYFSSGSDSSGQTMTVINGIGRHRSNAATADTWRIEKLNEVTLIQCKGWAGMDSTYGFSGATPFHILACSGISLYDCSAAFTTGSGFCIEKGIVGKGHDIHLVNCQMESCKTPVSFVSYAWRLFGVIVTIPAVGSVVDQGIVSGVVTFATALGIYVKDTTGGAWANGNIFQGGLVIGNLTSVDNDRITNFSLEHPQIKGSGVSPFIFTFSQLDNSSIKLNAPSGSDVFTVTVASTCLRLSLDIPPVITVTDNAVSTFINYKGYKKTIYTSITGGGSFRLQSALIGEVIDIIKNDVGTNEYVIWAAVGETIDGQPDLYLAGNATVGFSSARLVCHINGAWTIEAFTGRYCLYTGAVRLPYKFQEQKFIQVTGVAIGQQHVGLIITNEGAIGSCTYALVVTTILPGAKLTFIKIENQIVRIDPNGADEIRGGTGAGKYLQLTNVGDSVTLFCAVSGFWEILGSVGAYTFE